MNKTYLYTYLSHFYEQEYKQLIEKNWVDQCEVFFGLKVKKIKKKKLLALPTIARVGGV